MYKITGSRLRSCQQLAQEYAGSLANCSLVILQHLLKDTATFIQQIQKVGCRIHKVLGKDYSTDTKVLAQLRDAEIDTEVMDSTENPETEGQFLRNILIEALDEARDTGKKVVVHEIGGNFSRVVLEIPEPKLRFLAGVVEDTTFGHNRYLEIEKELRVPVFSVARSPLKEIEAVYVGEAVVLAFNNLMRELGISLPGRDVLTVGYGMIGEQITKQLLRHGIRPTIFDINPIKQAHAFVEGYKIIKNLDEIEEYDAIFSATGSRAIALDHMRRMKNGVMLISAGSKDTEFDAQALRDQSSNIESVGNEIEIYTLEEKEVALVRKGTPINFREESVPDEIIDIMFAEILMACVLLLDREYVPGVHAVPTEELEHIAKLWLKNMMDE